MTGGGGTTASSGAGGPHASSHHLRHGDGGVGHAVGEAPLVVVPGEHAHQPAVHDLGLREVEGGRHRVVVEVGGDERLAGHTQDALQLLRRGVLHGLVDLVHAGLAAGDQLEVHHRHVGRRHADGGAVELAIELGQHQAHGHGGAGGGRDHVERRGAGATHVLVRLVEDVLIVGV